jgi:hypothetical protein
LKGNIMTVACRKFPFFVAAAAALAILSLVLVTLSGHAARCQTARTIKIVVPYSPGGSGEHQGRVSRSQPGAPPECLASAQTKLLGVI